MDLIERVKNIIADLGISEREFAGNIGVLQRSLNYYLKGQQKPNLDFISKIAEIYPDISLEWLITGSGEMLKSENTVTAPKDMNGYRMVPLYNFDAVGGMNSSNEIVLDDPQFIESYVPFTDARIDDVCLRVTGNSMVPTYPSGSLLLIRRVPDWNEYFGYGNCFVLFLRDGRRILKEVQKFIENPREYVLCVSHNEDYPEEALPKNLITSVFKVMKRLTDEGY